MAWLASLRVGFLDWFTGASAGAGTGEAAAVPCYRAIVAQARQPAFYAQLAVPDSPQGRFELLLLHACLAMRRLGQDEPAAPRFTQALFDLMFADFDINLRELGVGDLGVGKRVHGWAASFRGRAAAYAGALHDADLMAAALLRNVYATVPAAGPHSHVLARYVLTADAALAAQTPAAVRAGEIHWPQIPFQQPEAA